MSAEEAAFQSGAEAMRPGYVKARAAADLWAQRRYPSLEGKVQVLMTASNDLDMMDRPTGTHTFAASVRAKPRDPK